MNIRSPLIQSLAGFFAALIIGALLPRTIGFLLKRVAFKSLREVAAIAAAGILTERLVHWIARTRTDSSPDQSP